MTEYNRVLLTHFPAESNFRGHVEPDGAPRPSLVGMILEEFVSLSTVEIVVSESARQTLEEQAPKQLLKRVRFINREDSDRKHAAFFAPLAEEFSVQFKAHSAIVAPPPHLSAELVEALNILHLLLDDFFVGIDHQVQVGVSPKGLRLAAGIIRAASQSSENRARLAALEGVLGLYHEERTPSLNPLDLRTSALVGAFAEILQDDLYKSLSQEAYALGIPARVRTALTAMGAKVGQLLKKPKVRQLFDLGSKGVSVATQIPMPDSQQAAELLGLGPYLPPYVNINSVVDRAHKSWIAMQSSASQ